MAGEEIVVMGLQSQHNIIKNLLDRGFIKEDKEDSLKKCMEVIMEQIIKYEAIVEKGN